MADHLADLLGPRATLRAAVGQLLVALPHWTIADRAAADDHPGVRVVDAVPAGGLAHAVLDPRARNQAVTNPIGPAPGHALEDQQDPDAVADRRLELPRLPMAGQRQDRRHLGDFRVAVTRR